VVSSGENWRRARLAAHAAGSTVDRDTQTVPLADAAGRVIAQPLIALTCLPGFDTAAMDGYAVAGRGPWTLTGTALAGAMPVGPLGAGSAVEVATGAATPQGTDGVIAYEQARVEAGVVGTAEFRSGQHVRRAGEEVAAGSAVVEAGRRITPAVIALAAAIGHDELPVRLQPRVCVVITGDEVVGSGIPGAGFVRDAIGPAIPSMLAWSGVATSSVQRVPDGAEPLLAALESADADMVIVSGSSSVGLADHLEKCLHDLGAQPVVRSVACAPGRTQSLWRLSDGRLLVGLPGNPLAAIVAYLTLVDPVCAGFLGTALPSCSTVAECDVAPHPTRTRLVPVRVTGDRALACGYDGSAMLRGVAAADALAVIEPDHEGRIDLLALPGGAR